MHAEYRLLTSCDASRLLLEDLRDLAVVSSSKLWQMLSQLQDVFSWEFFPWGGRDSERRTGLKGKFDPGHSVCDIGNPISKIQYYRIRKGMVVEIMELYEIG